jgi:hypothetical protein
MVTIDSQQALGPRWLMARASRATSARSDADARFGSDIDACNGHGRDPPGV